MKSPMKSPTKCITLDKNIVVEYPSLEMRRAGNQCRLYGSSTIYWSRKKRCYVIETDNHVILDGEVIGDPR